MALNDTLESPIARKSLDDFVLFKTDSLGKTLVWSFRERLWEEWNTSRRDWARGILWYGVSVIFKALYFTTHNIETLDITRWVPEKYIFQVYGQEDWQKKVATQQALFTSTVLKRQFTNKVLKDWRKLDGYPSTGDGEERVLHGTEEERRDWFLALAKSDRSAFFDFTHQASEAVDWHLVSEQNTPYDRQIYDWITDNLAVAAYITCELKLDHSPDEKWSSKSAAKIRNAQWLALAVEGAPLFNTFPLTDIFWPRTCDAEDRSVAKSHEDTDSKLSEIEDADDGGEGIGWPRERSNTETSTAASDESQNQARSKRHRIPTKRALESWVPIRPRIEESPSVSVSNSLLRKRTLSPRNSAHSTWKRQSHYSSRSTLHDKDIRFDQPEFTNIPSIILSRVVETDTSPEPQPLRAFSTPPTGVSKSNSMPLNSPGTGAHVSETSSPKSLRSRRDRQDITSYNIKVLSDLAKQSPNKHSISPDRMLMSSAKKQQGRALFDTASASRSARPTQSAHSSIEVADTTPAAPLTLMDEGDNISQSYVNAAVPTHPGPEEGIPEYIPPPNPSLTTSIVSRWSEQDTLHFLSHLKITDDDLTSLATHAFHSPPLHLCSDTINGHTILKLTRGHISNPDLRLEDPQRLWNAVWQLQGFCKANDHVERQRRRKGKGKGRAEDGNDDGSVVEQRLGSGGRKRKRVLDEDDDDGNDRESPPRQLVRRRRISDISEES